MVIVEVKSRQRGDRPEESLTDDKVRRLGQAAREYLHATGLEPEQMRYDIAMIEGGELRYTVNALTFDVAVAVPDDESDVY